MNTRKPIALLLSLVMLLSLLPAMTIMAAADDPLALPAKTATLTVTLDSDADFKVDQYRTVYVADPIDVIDTGAITPGTTTTDYQTMNIYVPENATAYSPIILMVQNGGWMPSKVGTPIEGGGTYSSTSDKDNVGAALKAGYVVVSMGTRSRGLQDAANNYVGHSPAVVTDVKAGIRYLRYNAAAGLLPAGNTERIVVTGTSGGGGLSAAVAASGNSQDYFKSLYEIGAAGMTSATVSTLRDDVFATIAYCPITDFTNADQAYEWMYGGTRSAFTDNPAIGGDPVLAASAALAAAYPAYVTGLGLKLEDGSTALTGANFKAAIIALLEKELEEAYVERGAAGMAADLVAVLTDPPQRGDLVYGTNSPGWTDWYSIDGDGNATITDFDKFLYFVARNADLKTAPAFSNYKSTNAVQQNEDNLFGASLTDEYSPFEFWSWANNAVSGDGIGGDDISGDWDTYLTTDPGKIVAQQLKMVNPIPYLTSGSEGDSAPYWYVRHGMRDRDTSFAVEALLYYALINDTSIEDVDFEFAWLQPHSGNYDVQEAYEWLADIVTYNAVEVDVPYVSGGDPVLQTLDIYYPQGTVPAGGWPTVIYVHGGGYRAGDKAEVGPSLSYAQMALDNGFAMVSVNYRLQTAVTLAEQIADIDAALDFLAAEAGDYYLNPNALALMGPSAGGGLIAAAATNDDGTTRPVAVITMAGGMGGTALDTTLYPDGIVDRSDPYFYMAQGLEDSQSFIDGARAFAAALKAVGVSYILEEVPGAKHTRIDDVPNLYEGLDGLGKLNDAYDWLKDILAGRWPRTSGGGGGGGSTTAVSVPKPANGSVSVNRVNPAKGDAVTVTVKPDTGYQVGALTITDRNGKVITAMDNGDGTYTFTYDGVPVTIKATFVPLGTPVAPTEPFTDVAKTDWFYEAVMYALENKLMNGVSADAFAPLEATSRAMVVTVLFRLEGESAVTGTNRFTDLTQDWYKDAVQWAVENDISNGTSDTAFDPGASVTREQLVTMLYRYAQFKGYDVSATADLSGFTDAGSISPWALEAMKWANAIGLITGETETSLNPTGASTRAVFATIMMRFCEYDFATLIQEDDPPRESLEGEEATA